MLNASEWHVCAEADHHGDQREDTAGNHIHYESERAVCMEGRPLLVVSLQTVAQVMRRQCYVQVALDCNPLYLMQKGAVNQSLLESLTVSLQGAGRTQRGSRQDSAC